MSIYLRLKELIEIWCAKNEFLTKEERDGWVQRSKEVLEDFKNEITEDQYKELKAIVDKG